MTEKTGNIILIGMPTSGKSTVGVILAKMLGMDFLDTDIVLQRKEGSKLQTIIETQGIDTFLRKEERAVLGIQTGHSVIATGGSVVYSEAAMKHLSEGGTVVYLKITPEKLKKRLTDVRGRGVVLRPGESLEEMFAERAALYERYGDITVTETGTIEDTVREVLEELQKLSGKSF
ncbi:MAG: shikimate kinase [Lachnospiraceae bacterium]|nr:shikimate kinase [Lachnospiraceae bacterium]